MHNNIIFHALLNIGAALRAHFSRLEPCRQPVVKLR
ncbi:hypothetical protein HDG42_006620 [Paraburkholderia sp. JPY171]|nr:hypothetical protein [Paraburkholderia atlantica]